MPGPSEARLHTRSAGNVWKYVSPHSRIFFPSSLNLLPSKKQRCEWVDATWSGN